MKKNMLISVLLLNLSVLKTIIFYTSDLFVQMHKNESGISYYKLKK